MDRIAGSVIPPATQECVDCGEVKPFSMFHSTPVRGRDPFCGMCRAVRRRRARLGRQSPAWVTR